MKTKLCLLAVCLCVCLLFSMASAETVSSLKAFGVDSLTFTINSESVSVPLILPDADTIPVRYANPYAVNLAALKELYGKYLGYTGGQTGYFSVDHDFNRTIPSGNMMSAYAENGIPENNNLPADAPEKLFLRILEEITLPLEFRIDRVLATTGAYRYSYVTEDISDKQEQARRYSYNSDKVYYCQRIDFSRPVSGRTQGYYELHATQIVDGIAVFSDYYTDDCTNAHQYNGYDYAVTDGGIAVVRMQSETVYDFWFSGLIEPLDILADDVTLPSLEKLRQVIQERIDSGELRSIDSIELGYTLALRIHDGKPMEPQMCSENQSSVCTADDPAYVLTPCWRVNGYDLKDGARRLEYGLTEPTAWERYVSGKYELRFDAQTLKAWNEPISLE